MGREETLRTLGQLRLGQLTLGLASIESVRPMHGFNVGAGPPRAEVVLWVNDVDQAFAALKTKGAKVLSVPHDFIGTVRGRGSRIPMEILSRSLPDVLSIRNSPLAGAIVTSNDTLGQAFFAPWLERFEHGRGFVIDEVLSLRFQT